MKNVLQHLVVNALFIALVAIGTMVINIPMPATRGFVNVGDTMVFAAGVLLGWPTGLIAGGLGSSLADMLLGYVHWAPWTLVIKGFEGVLVALLAHHTFIKTRRVTATTLVAMTIAAGWMVFAYYVAAGIIEGFNVALTSIPGNSIQGLSSIFLGSLLISALGRVKAVSR